MSILGKLSAYAKSARTTLRGKGITLTIKAHVASNDPESIADAAAGAGDVTVKDADVSIGEDLLKGTRRVFTKGFAAAAVLAVCGMEDEAAVRFGEAVEEWHDAKRLAQGTQKGLPAPAGNGKP